MKNEIFATKGKIFSVVFTKKNGEDRKMHCRLGVTKHLKGGISRNSNPNHIVVYDLDKKAYRTLNLATVKEFNFQGKVYTVKKRG